MIGIVRLDRSPEPRWRPESRLLLQPVKEARAPFWTTEGDYSVIWRGTKVESVSYDHKPYGHGTRLERPAIRLQIRSPGAFPELLWRVVPRS